MDVLDKLTILTDAAKYDAACTSSGGDRAAKRGYLGNTSASVAGCCHTFSADGRCVTLLKVLLTNRCVYDCKYCVNRRSNDTPRAAFTPEELADLTIQFYRRNYIEGLFLSSGVYRSPDYTTELMIRTLRLLRETYRFNGYIHAKAIPGTSPELVEQLGMLADRLSVNIELPSEAGLKTLAPDKTKQAILAPMRQIQTRSQQSKEELVKYRHAPRFAPAGQSTQLIVGATADSDLHILRLTQGLYFAVRELHCTAGVMVTASHNPPEYNGYKVYWEDGAQITAPKDVEIINEVQSITDYGALKTMSEEDAKAAGLYEVIGSEIDDKYMEALKKLVLRPEAIKEQADKLKIVYTPLHGTGNLPVRRVLKELGFTQVHVVKEQELPDGDFPTVSYPNPEDMHSDNISGSDG